jgi:hypothetical protein
MNTNFSIRITPFLLTLVTGFLLKSPIGYCVSDAEFNVLKQKVEDKSFATTRSFRFTYE